MFSLYDSRSDKIYKNVCKKIKDFGSAVPSETFREILAKAFVASTLLEEGNKTTFSLILEHKGDSFKNQFIFETPESFDPTTLKKISGAFQWRYEALILNIESSQSTDDEQKSNVSQSNDKNQQENPARLTKKTVLAGFMSLEDFNEKGEFVKISAFSAGCLNIAVGKYRIAIIRTGELIELRDNSLSFDGLASKLAESGFSKDFFIGSDNLLPGKTDAKVFQYFLQKLTEHILEKGTGGIVIVKISNGNKEKLDNITPTYRLRENITKINTENDLQKYIYKIGSLGTIDGALIIDQFMRPLAFGAKLNAPALEDEKIVKHFDIHKCGMRHRSTIQYIAATKDAFALTISEDGGIHLFVQVKYNNEIAVQSFNMDLSTKTNI